MLKQIEIDALIKFNLNFTSIKLLCVDLPPMKGYWPYIVFHNCLKILYNQVSILTVYSQYVFAC